MKKLGITCLAVVLPLISSYACANTEAYGYEYNEQTMQDVKIVNITCSSCYDCVNAEGNPIACNTVCLAISTVSPTHMIYQYNPNSGQYDPIGTPSGSCQMYTTTSCPQQ
jgi:hypothetical protein